MATASKYYDIHMMIMECCLPDEVGCEGVSAAYLKPVIGLVPFRSVVALTNLYRPAVVYYPDQLKSFGERVTIRVLLW